MKGVGENMLALGSVELILKTRINAGIALTTSDEIHPHCATSNQNPESRSCWNRLMVGYNRSLRFKK